MSAVSPHRPGSAAAASPRGTHYKESLGVRDYEAAKPLFAVSDTKWQARKKVAWATI